MVAVKTNSFISSCDVDIETDIEIRDLLLLQTTQRKSILVGELQFVPRRSVFTLHQHNYLWRLQLSETPMAFFICYFIR